MKATSLRGKGKIHLTNYQSLSIKTTLKNYYFLINLELPITEEIMYYSLNGVGTHYQSFVQQITVVHILYSTKMNSMWILDLDIKIKP